MWKNVVKRSARLLILELATGVLPTMASTISISAMKLTRGVAVRLVAARRFAMHALLRTR